MTNRQRKFFKHAKAASEMSSFPKVHIGAIVTCGSKVVGVGFNSRKSSPIQKKYNIERTFNYEQNYLFSKTVTTTYLSFKIQSPEWLKRTRNLDSVVW